MEKVTTITGVAAPMAIENVDTDMIIPSQHLKVVTTKGLGKFAFYNLRYDAQGKPDPDFVLNKEQYRNVPIIIARSNFGCGSSREHAVWALMDLGVRCVIAPSFGKIFANNVVYNGFLLATVPEDVIEDLLQKAERGANAVFTVDLISQEITDPDGNKIPFGIEAYRRQALLAGEDNKSVPPNRLAAIKSFESKQRTSQPWAWRNR
jgi:3-isopropylmalate/(R)-2-methylmalate dehydratase small subunit